MVFTTQLDNAVVSHVNLLPLVLLKGINTENTGIQVRYTAQIPILEPVQSQPVPPALFLNPAIRKYRSKTLAEACLC